MKERSCVVVAVDFSEPSRRALEIAALVSARAKLPLELIHVFNPIASFGPSEVAVELQSWLGDQQAAVEGRLERWAQSARERGARVSQRVVIGSVSRTLAELAESLGAHMIVLGRRGTAGLSHVLLGSVSERVVHLATCPVLVVPKASPAKTPPRRLMVGVDFSKSSKDAYHAALQLADVFKLPGGVLVAHARLGDQDLWLANWSELAHRHKDPHDEGALERWAEPPHATSVAIETRILSGETEEILLRAADREACDWLVLGRQGRSGLTALMMGSTTDRIIKRADRPVLVIPTTG